MSFEALFATLEALTPERVIERARAIEAAREPWREHTLSLFHGFARSDLWLTPFMLAAGELGRAHGCFAFDRLERHFPPPAPAWLGPEHAGLDFAVTIDGDHVQASKYWPFSQDAALADFELTTSPKWLGHGILHTLVGFGWWPALTAWDVLHMARLSEAVAAWWWYWLAELGRAHCPQHSVHSFDWTPVGCPACQTLAAGMASRDVRLERLAGAEAAQAEGLDFLRREIAAYKSGLETGELAVPVGWGLTVGEACDYARVHTLRLQSRGFRRWVEAMLEPERDYAQGTADFAARAAAVLRELMEPPVEPEPSAQAAARAARVCQDVGWRLCHAAALAGDDARYARGLGALADAARALRGGAPPETLTAALAAAHDDYADAPAPGLAPHQLFALGYQPGPEPPTVRAARAIAYQQRLDTSGSLARAIVRAWPAGAHAVIDGRRRQPNLTAELLTIATSPGRASRTLDQEMAAFLHFMLELTRAAGPDDTRRIADSLWYYRFTQPELPAPRRWAETTLRINPYLDVVECPYDVDRMAALLDGSAPIGAAPPLARTDSYIFVGPGRRHPRALPGTSDRLKMIDALSEPRPMAALLDAGCPLDALERALAEDLVIAVSGPAVVK